MRIRVKTEKELAKLPGGHCVHLWLTPGKEYDANEGFTVPANENAFGEDREGFEVTDDSGYTQVWTAAYFNRV